MREMENKCFTWFKLIIYWKSILTLRFVDFLLVNVRLCWLSPCLCSPTSQHAARNAVSAQIHVPFTWERTLHSSTLGPSRLIRGHTEYIGGWGVGEKESQECGKILRKPAIYTLKFRWPPHPFGSSAITVDVVVQMIGSMVVIKLTTFTILANRQPRAELSSRWVD